MGPRAALAAVVALGCATGDPLDSVSSGGGDATVRVWDGATGAVVQESHSPRPYDGLDITGVAGLTDAEVRMLKQLGAVER